MDTGLSTLAFGMPNGWEYIILLVIGLLIFGRRLPEVGRSLGQGILEFKRGLKGVADEVETESNKPGKTTAALPKSEPAMRLEAPRGAEGQEVRVSRADAVE